MRAPKVAIGIDPGTRCGWAVLDQEGGWIRGVGTWQLDNRRGDGAGMRYLRFERLLRELLGAYEGPVAYELVAGHKGTEAAQIYGGIVAHITRVCEELGRPYAGIPVATIKRHATGKGNANKEAMIDRARARWGLETCPGNDDNQADALFVASALREGLA